MPMSELHLLIVTPEAKLFDGPITQVIAPGVWGAFAVRDGHAPLISALEAGVVQVRVGFDEQTFAVDGGFLEVRKNEVVILAGWAEAIPPGTDVKSLLAGRRSQPEAAAKPS